MAVILALLLGFISPDFSSLVHQCEQIEEIAQTAPQEQLSSRVDECLQSFKKQPTDDLEAALQRALYKEHFLAASILLKLPLDIQKIKNWSSEFLDYANQHDLITQVANKKAFLGIQTPHLGDTLLHAAARCNNLMAVKLLVECGADVNVKNQTGQTPLHEAAYIGSVPVGAFLLQHGATINSIAAYKLTPLNVALSYEHEDFALLLIQQGAALLEPPIGEDTVLHLAADKGMITVAEQLLKKGALVNAKNYYGYTPLDKAITAGQLEMANLLIQAGADIQPLSLHTAAHKNDKDLIELLLANGAPLKALDQEGCTALHYAYGNVDILQRLIEKGLDPRLSDYRGQTPLDQAIRHHCIDAVRFLIPFGMNQQEIMHLLTNENTQSLFDVIKPLVLEGKADLNATDGDMTPLVAAVYNNHLDYLQLLIANKVDLDSPTYRGETALLRALRWGKQNIAQLLIDNGCNINTTSSYGTTPLHMAVENGLLDIAALLIEKGADVNATDRHGQGPLFLASDAALVDLLVSKGAKIDAIDREGRTPLFKAVKNGFDSAKRLLEHGASATMKDFAGKTVFHVAAWSSFDLWPLLVKAGADIHATSLIDGTALHAATADAHLELVEYLIQQGADLNARDFQGRTPLHIAAEYNKNNTIAALLLSAGCCPDLKDYREETPLFRASYQHNLELVKLLASYGADINTPEISGQTPLMMAHLDLKEWLIDQGADLDMADSRGYTALHYSILRSSADTLAEIELLLRKGANVNANSLQESCFVTLLHTDHLNILSIAKLLIEKGADLTARAPDGRGLLELAQSLDKSLIDLLEHTIHTTPAIGHQPTQPDGY
jgi:ankyrin repeat protein